MKGANNYYYNRSVVYCIVVHNEIAMTGTNLPDSLFPPLKCCVG